MSLSNSGTGTTFALLQQECFIAAFFVKLSAKLGESSSIRQDNQTSHGCSLFSQILSNISMSIKIVRGQCILHSVSGTFIYN